MASSSSVVTTENTDDDVFLNGDNGSPKSIASSGDGVILDRKVPRRSSLIKDHARRNSDKKKTVSFTSLPSEKAIVTVQACLNSLQRGADFIKVKSNGNHYRRTFYLDPTLTEIRWHPSHKKPDKAKVNVDAVCEVRAGKNTDTLRNEAVAGRYSDDCALSIIYGDNFECLDLIASTPEDASVWVTGLTYLVSGRNRAPDVIDGGHIRDRWLMEIFQSANVDDSGQIDEIEVTRLVKKLNNGLATTRIQHKLKEIVLQQPGECRRKRLNSQEFIDMFKEISTRPEIYYLLVRQASRDEYLTLDDLQIFLESEQGMSKVSKEYCLQLIGRFEPSDENQRLLQMGIDGFTQYLMSEDCDIFNPTHKHVCEDMTMPLSHYFIASSHNTYLLGDQLKGLSSVDAYQRALCKGCRCVELECWDGPNDDPLVYHGHTLTTKISFSSVITTIKEYAFRVSEYPVTIVLEDHCGVVQQRRMVAILKDVLGSQLYVSAPNTDGTTCQLPSPESCRFKFFIMGKKLPDSCAHVTEGDVTDEDDCAEVDKPRFGTRRRTSSTSSMRRFRLAKELSDITTFSKTSHFVDFKSQKQNVFDVCTLSETAVLKFASSSSNEFVQYCKQHICRVLPNSLRVDSSNCNPQDVWNCGYQMMAMNYQTCGLMMDLNDGRFLQNGGCGYVLKPAIMREEVARFSANSKDIIPGVTPQIVRIKVISAQQLPKPRGSGAKGDTVDPYVTVEVSGIPIDCATERTKTVRNNGINPVYVQSFEFNVNFPDLALVRFAVLDDEHIGDDFIAQYTAPLVCLHTGYRHVRLKSLNGEPVVNCTLFVHIAVTSKTGGGQSLLRKSPVLKRSRSKRSYVGMRATGIRAVDELLRTSVLPIKEGTDLRDDVRVSLSSLMEACHLAQTSSVKQCVRTLYSRVQQCEGASLAISLRDERVLVDCQGIVPEVVKKAHLALSQLMKDCSVTAEKADLLYDKLTSIQKAVLEMHDDLDTLAKADNIKGKRYTKAIENFAWNVRTLKGQAELIRSSKDKCMDYTSQVRETAEDLRLLVDNNSVPPTQYIRMESREESVS